MATAGSTIVLRAGPLTASVTAAGALTIGWDRPAGAEPDWLGPATLVVPGGHSVETAVAGPTVTIAAGPVRASVRAWDDRAVIVLRLEATEPIRGGATGELAQPAVAWRFEPRARAETGAPPGLRAFGYQYTEFALPVFSDELLAQWRLLPFRPAVVMPLGLAAPDGRTLLLAPLDAFHEQVIAVPATADDAVAGVRAGWHGDLDDVPAGFATELAVIAGDGPRDCFAQWGALLRARSGVAPPGRDRDVLGRRLSYWTDNGSAYWYRTEPGHDVASGIVATVDDLEARGMPIAAVQLDSWFYPHDVLRPFDTDEWEVPPTGLLRWEPRDDILPGGIAPLRERLRDRPLVAHCRHLSASSPYLAELACWVDGDRAHPQVADLYERYLDQAVAWGIDVFEHDWLIECFLGVRALRAAPGRATEWQQGLDRALGRRGLTAQWCMASPADFAGATALANVTSIRTSGDHGYLVAPPVLWAWFLHTNLIARGLGLWPFKDVFRAAADRPERDVEALLSALSAGPVGVGDPLGAADPAVVRRTCRADGVLVRPDVPIAATDRAAYDAPVWASPSNGAPGAVVGTTFTDHPAGRWGYVATLNVAIDPHAVRATVALDECGADLPGAGAWPEADVVVWDWRTRTATPGSASARYDVELDPAGWDYRVVAPVLAGGIAVIGDPTLYATAGDARLAGVTVGSDGSVRAIVLGAGERVTVTGWSAGPIDASAWTPAGVTDLDLARDERTGVWELAVEVPASGWVATQLRRT